MTAPARRPAAGLVVAAVGVLDGVVIGLHHVNVVRVTVIVGVRPLAVEVEDEHLDQASLQLPSNHATLPSSIRRSIGDAATRVWTRAVRPDVTVPPRTHPQESAKIDVPHTSCIPGPLKSLARNDQEGERS